MHACMIFVDRLSSLGDSNVGCACLGPQSQLHNNSLYNIVDLCTACVSLYLGESMHYNIYIYIYCSQLQIKVPYILHAYAYASD